ncbi:MAG TPA: UDP-N-acetylmuramate--L-alanine ligase [Candidatus Binataceae bacterium]|nr:UDP-N-acetylmuramate--L-alanine ligase [Candidatus Binataceae bacterium]
MSGLPTGLLTRHRRLHFIGIGGAGMSGIAELCQRLGFEVSGCDMHDSATTRRLATLGIALEHGHHPSHIGARAGGDLDAVIISSAVKFSNPEVVRARALKIPVIARAEMLGELLRMARQGIAVAGTHGKTTTTSLVGLILEEAGFDPTVAIGGNLRARGTNVRLGRGDFMVAEADESDASFLLLLPTIAIVTNIDPEHLDHYGSMDRVREAYLSFINRVPFYGRAVLGIDSVNVRGLLASVRKPIITYGEAADADLRAERIVIDGLSTHFVVMRGNVALGTVTIPSPGRHLALNSLAAIAVTLEMGIPFEVAARALRTFSGISRRFELKGEAAGRLVLDDYAHHPAEVRATLAAARAAFARRLVTVFQPHRYTRLRDLFDDFLTAFDDTDVLYLADVYAAGEEPIPDVTSRRLYEALRARGHLDVHYLGDETEPAGTLARESKRGDVFVTLGAGDVYLIGERLLALLGEEPAVTAKAAVSEVKAV